MVQVKLIVEEYVQDMECQINEFLQLHKKAAIKDIKFQQVASNRLGFDPKYVCVATIIYED